MGVRTSFVLIGSWVLTGDKSIGRLRSRGTVGRLDTCGRSTGRLGSRGTLGRNDIIRFGGNFERSVDRSGKHTSSSYAQQQQQLLGGVGRPSGRE